MWPAPCPAVEKKGRGRIRTGIGPSTDSHKKPTIKIQNFMAILLIPNSISFRIHFMLSAPLKLYRIYTRAEGLC